MSRRDKRTSANVVPLSTGKIARAPAGIKTVDEATFRWKVSPEYIELEHKEWGWRQIPIERFFHILASHLHRFEDTAWHELDRQKHCHPVPAAKIEKPAQVLLRDRQPGMETLYQVGVGGPARVWGYRAKDVLYLMWYDPNHTVYKPSGFKR
ncbi:MAG: hypothetical protein Q7O66_05905 [Dehalococcoidia bacterium]|nr:hypothetical protein [Dehalococcoidia bacterium]